MQVMDRKGRLNFRYRFKVYPESQSKFIRYLNIDHVSDTLRKARKALHFIMHILKKGNNNMKRLAYTALVRLILEYGAVCWDDAEKVR